MTAPDVAAAREMYTKWRDGVGPTGTHASWDWILTNSPHTVAGWIAIAKHCAAQRAAGAAAERERCAKLEEVIESIALVTGYTEPLPGSLVGHVKLLVDEVLRAQPGAPPEAAWYPCEACQRMHGPGQCGIKWPVARPEGPR